MQIFLYNYSRKDFHEGRALEVHADTGRERRPVLNYAPGMGKEEKERNLA